MIARRIDARIRALAIGVFALSSACEVSHPTDGGGPNDATMMVDDAIINPLPCVTSTDCQGCASHVGCGWCGASSQCVAGGADGPTAGGCAMSSWTWLPMQCPGQGDAGDPGQHTDCTLITSCGACADQLQCGFCANTSQCLPGSSGGPTNGACAGADWIVAADHCAP